MTTLRQLVSQGADTLRRTGIEAPHTEAQRILAHILRIDRARLAGAADAHAAGGIVDAYLAKIEHRSGHAPLSHVLGYRDFWKHRFRINPFVLDPRPETEVLVAAALDAPFDTVLDLGTGSGCIVISLLAERPQARGMATDISPEALDVARLNAREAEVDSRLELREADWGEGLDGRFDLIVSNPPYIAVAEMEGLDPVVRDHEPRLALTDEGDGLGAFRAIASQAPALLAAGGRLALEFGQGQEDSVGEILRSAGFSPPRIHADLDGRPRVAVAEIEGGGSGSNR